TAQAQIRSNSSLFRVGVYSNGEVHGAGPEQPGQAGAESWRHVDASAKVAFESAAITRGLAHPAEGGAKAAGDQRQFHSFRQSEGGPDQSSATAIRLQAEDDTLASAVFVFKEFPFTAGAGPNKRSSSPLRTKESGPIRGLKLHQAAPEGKIVTSRSGSSGGLPIGADGKRKFMIIRSTRYFAILLLAVASTSVSIAQDTQSNQSGNDTGKLRVYVSPEEAYIWVDGKPMAHRDSSLKLPAGKHKIAVYNYGYLPEVQEVTVIAGQEL